MQPHHPQPLCFGCPSCGSRSDVPGDCACGDMVFDLRTESGRDVLMDADEERKSKFMKRLYALSIPAGIVLSIPAFMFMSPIAAVVFAAALAIVIQAVGRRYAPQPFFPDVSDFAAAKVASDFARASHERQQRH